MRKAYLYIITLTLLVSCTREVEVKIDDFSPKLIINSTFQEDSFLRVHLSTSSQVIDDGEVIDDGTVSLYDPTNSFIENLVAQSGGYYQSNVKMKPGVLYSIQAKYEELECLASDSLPLEFSSISVDTSRVIFVKGAGFFLMELDIPNIHMADEFYEIAAELNYWEYTIVNGVKVDSVLKNKEVELLSSDVKISSNPENANFKNKYLIEDRYFDGKPVAFGTYDVKKLRSNERPESIVLKLRKHGEQGFHYFNTLYSHLFFRSIPFALPVEVKGNVKNGYGVFVGIREYKKVIKF